eukprot:1136685-Pelagomonas_calceolata.AAC.3
MVTHTVPTQRLTNLTESSKHTCSKYTHNLGSADTSGYYNNSWQRLNYAMQPTPETPLSIRLITAHPLNLLKK